MAQIGGTHSTRPGPDDAKTLKQLNFQVLNASAVLCGLVALHAQSTSCVPKSYLGFWDQTQTHMFPCMCCRQGTSWTSASCDE